MTVTGADHGLVLELFLDQTNYMYNKLSRTAGARIDVHDPQWENDKFQYTYPIGTLSWVQYLAALGDVNSASFTVKNTVTDSIVICYRQKGLKSNFIETD